MTKEYYILVEQRLEDALLLLHVLVKVVQELIDLAFRKIQNGKQSLSKL